MEQIETDQVVHNWRDNHNKNAAIMLTFIVMMIAKIITLMLPKKYFFDNNILNLYIDLKLRPNGLFLFLYEIIVEINTILIIYIS